MKLYQSFLLLLLVFGAVSAQAKSKVPNWYKIPAEDYQAVVADVPQPGSKKFYEDFETLLQFQATRGDMECKLGRYLKWPNFAPFFSKDKPDFLNDKQLPIKFDQLLSESEVEKYKSLMNRVLRYSSKVTTYYKEKYERARPSKVNPDVQPCAEVPEGNTSYPSSHTAKGVLLGCLFHEKFDSQSNKARADFFLQYGEYMGDLRAIIGVHHPSDVEAGKNIGYAICERLLNEEEFVKAFEAL